MNEVFIEDKYNYHTFSYLEDLITFTLNKLKVSAVTFTVILTSDEELQYLNKTYRGIDRPTDVISFALNDNGAIPGPINALGDIYISIPMMKRQAMEYHHSEKRELSFLTIHGVLHLLGYDHTLAEEETIMFTLQKEILEEAGIIS